MSQLNNLLWYLLPFGLNTIIQLISLSVYTKYLSPSDFGFYALVIVYGTISVAIANAGLLNIYQRNFFEINTEQRKNLLFSNIAFVILMLMVLSLLSYIIFDFVTILFNLNSISVTWLLVGLNFLGIQSLNQFFFSTLKNTYKAKEFSIFQILEKLLSFLFSLLFIIHYEFKFEGILLGQLISVTVLFIYFFLTQFEFSTRFHLGLLTSSLRLSIPLSVSNLVKVFGNQSDKYMIGYFNAVSGVGIYDIAQKIANLSFVFSTAIQNVYSPKVYKKLFSDHKNKFSEIGHYLTPFFFLVCFFSFVLSVFSEEIILIFTTDEYVQAMPIIMLLTILYCTHFFTKQPQLIFAKKTKLLSTISISVILLNILLNIFLIKIYGLFGAAYSTFISGIIYAVVYFYNAQKFVPIHWEKKKILFLYSFLIAGIVIVFIFFYLNLNYNVRLLLKILLVVIYVFMAAHFNIINRKTIDNILSTYLKK